MQSGTGTSCGGRGKRREFGDVGHELVCKSCNNRDRERRSGLVSVVAGGCGMIVSEGLWWKEEGRGLEW